jgi:hypothetical protein
MATEGVTRTLVVDVTAWAQGNGIDNIAIQLTGNGTSVGLRQVTALCENGSNYNNGLVIFDGAMVSLHGGSITARGGQITFGVSNGDSYMEAESVTVLAENGSSGNAGLGIYGNDSAISRLRGGSYTGRGGTLAYGIINEGGNATLEAEGIIALGENGSSDSFGLLNSYATAMVNSSQFIGSSSGLYLIDGTVHLGVSQLDGGATRDSGTLTCFQVYDENYTAYTCP